MIKVYSKADCPYCDMLKNLLKYYNTEFENIDVSRNKKLIKKVSGQYSVPVIDIDGKIFVGFDREKIKEILKLN